MTAAEFCTKWGIKRSELALLLDVPQQSVRHWTSEKSNQPESPAVLKSLDRLDFIFELLRLADREIPEVVAVFLALTNRRKGTAFRE